LRNDSIEKELVQTIIQVIKEKEPQTVKQLAGFVKERVSVGEREIVESILKLQSQGKITLEKVNSSELDFLFEDRKSLLVLDNRNFGGNNDVRGFCCSRKQFSTGIHKISARHDLCSVAAWLQPNKSVVPCRSYKQETLRKS